MKTAYDWLTIAVFAGLVVLYLQRSMADEPKDKVWHYLPPAIGCAGANWLGNEQHHLFSLLVLAATIAYIFIVLRPSLRLG